MAIEREIKINEFGLVRIGSQHHKCKGFQYNLNNTCALDQRTYARQLNKIHHLALFQEALFKPAILAAASGIIGVHNHPSGDPAPSRADIQVTRNLREAGQIIGIDLIDHMIIGDGTRYYSFSESGLV